MKYVKKEEKQKEKFDLQECFTLWRHNGKNDTSYMSGFDFNKNKLIGFTNNKQKENQPLIRIYSVNEDGSIGSELITLWESKSKAGRDYLSGLTNENEKLIAFYGDEHNEKQPYLKGYFKKD